jgi:hypothetical protein
MRCYLDWSSLTPAVVIAIGSLVIACCSFIITFFNYCRSNYAVIRVLASENSGGAAAGRGRYNEFRIVIQNFGIPLHNIGMSLQYSPDGFGWLNFLLKTRDKKVIREGQFAKGAITEFVIATDYFDDNDDAFIRSLNDLKSQRARLILHADQYRMWSYNLHDRLWWLKRRWNRFAGRLNIRMMRTVTTPRGTKGVKQLFQIPIIVSPGQHLLHFAAVVHSTPASTTIPPHHFQRPAG